MKRSIVILLLLLQVALSAQGQQTAAPGTPAPQTTLTPVTEDGVLPPGQYAVDAPRLPGAPVLDGKLDDPVWQSATLLDNFIQYEPDEGVPAEQKTEVRVGYDTQNLYFGVRCYDSEPDKIVAAIRQRDGALDYDDSVRIFLDTFHDRKNAFTFWVNPLGAMTDGVLRNEGEEQSLDWDGLWDAATSRDGEGWTAEIAIPFKTLRFAKNDPHVWGFNVQRYVARTREESYWRPVLRAWGHNGRFRVSEYAELHGMTDLVPGGRYQLKPYVLSRARRDDFGARDDTTTGDLGGDLKFNITPGLVADLTVNTDFAEVEADQQQVNLNRFKLFYPEKREFFLEGANLFYFGDRIEPYDVPERFIFFFSRQIGLTENGLQEVPVLGGAKVAGKAGDWSIGALNLTTEDVQYENTLGQRVEEPQTNYSVLRLKKDLYAGSTIGLIGLNKEASGNGDNLGYGFDWDLKLPKGFGTMGYVTRTSTPGVDGGDSAFSGDILYRNKIMRVRTVYTEIGENFNPEMGFITRIGIRKSQGDVGFILTPGKKWLHKLFLISDLNYVTNLDNELESRNVKLEANLVARDKSGIAWIYTDNTEVLTTPLVIQGVLIPPGSYRFHNLFTGIGTDYSRKVGTTIWYETGTFYGGDRWHGLVSLAFKPVEGMVLVTQYDRNEVDLPNGSFTTDIASANVAYSFTARLFSRVILQWNKDDNFRANLLLDWAWRPGSNIYLVYNSTEDLLDVTRGSRLSTLAPGHSLTLKVARRFDF